MPSNEPPFLDVPLLLELSEPRPRVNWFWYGVASFLLVSLGGAYLSATSTTGKAFVEVGSIVLTLGVITAMSMVTAMTMRGLRAAQMQIEAAAELVQLRRWPEAAVTLATILSQPLRTHGMRFEALLYLTNVLARYDRFDDALTVQNHLLEERLDPATERAIKLGRAMALLRQDRLFDADRAIADLRRGDARDQSGGLALVEIYRDVKTGHPAEAIDTFNLRQDLLRDQLGHRVADAWVLVAKAHDQLDHAEEARQAYNNATLLSAVGELDRRYPEVADLKAKYRVVPAPDSLTPSPGTPGGGGEGRRGILNPSSTGDKALTQPSPGVPGEGSGAEVSQ